MTLLPNSGHKQMSSSPLLKQLLIDDLPPAFIRVLLERIEQIYPESYMSMLNNPSLGEEQANYVLGYYRRALGESVLQNTAAEHGLSIQLVQPDNGGCKHIYISTEKFGFSMCHVSKSGGFPKHSDSREQSSKINEHLSQGSLFPIESTTNNQKFYGVLVHTEHSGKKDSFQSLCVGFPNRDFDDWIEEPINLHDLMDIQHRLFKNHDDLHAQIQNPTPVWKHNTDKINEADE